MAVTVGKRIQSMINHMDCNEIELALSDVCIAIDVTAKKYYNKPVSSADCYKEFLKENMWMIVNAGMSALTSETIKLPFTHKDIKSDSDGYCTLEQIVYHVMRCGLIHDTGENSKIVWNDRISLAIDSDGNLNISPNFIWGLALCVVTCSVNKDEKVGDTCWISIATFKYLINDLWGKRDTIKKIIKSQYNLNVE